VKFKLTHYQEFRLEWHQRLQFDLYIPRPQPLVRGGWGRGIDRFQGKRQLYRGLNERQHAGGAEMLLCEGAAFGAWERGQHG